MKPSQYKFGQGTISLAEVDPVTGVRGKWFEVGDVSAMSLSLESASIKHYESQSGVQALAVDYAYRVTSQLTMIIRSFDLPNLALFTRGEVVKTAGGTVTNESLGSALAIGDTVMLDHPKVESVTITAGETTLVAGTDYTLDADFGKVTFITAQTGAVTAAYTYGATEQLAMLKIAASKNYALRFDELNIVAGGQKSIVEIYKISPSLLSSLSFISSGEEVDGAEVTAGALIDQTRPATGDLGQFGRIIRL
jgi:hypothetical protein